MDRNKLLAILAYKLESGGVQREHAITTARSFVGSLSQAEADKLSSLADNDAAMTQLANSLRDRISQSGVQKPNTAAQKPAAVRASQPQAQPKPQQTNAQQQSQERSPMQPKPQQTQNQTQPQAQRTPQAQPQMQAQSQQPRSQQIPAYGTEENDGIADMFSKQRPRREQSAENQPSQNARHPQQRPQPQSQQPSRREENQQHPRPVRTEQKPQKKQSGSAAPAPKKSKTAPADAERKVIYKPDPNADYQKFYIILACTSPLWIFALLLIVTAFLLVIGALCAGIAGLVLLLVLGVAAGTVVSLIGIIYGITQLFTYAPIGLYEIGLGCMIGGVVMLVGIIVYNIAIRLLPYLIKKVLSLLSITANKLVELYYHVKGACADL